MSAPAPGQKKMVIGVGNAERGDDAVGLWAARRLRERNLPGVTAYELTGDATLLLDIWENADVVCLIDAVYSGAEPGKLHRLDAGGQPLAATFFRLSSHGAGVADAVELGRALRRLPARLLIYGVEGSNFAPGGPLSPEAMRGAELAVEAIVTDLREVERAPARA